MAKDTAWSSVLFLLLALVLPSVFGLSVSIANPLKLDSEKDKCDLFSGAWTPNPSGPFYTNNTCRFMSDYQDCTTNGRPDQGYLHWRWKPYDCDLPRFDARKFLETMRDKTLAFIGDSIFRNQGESLACMLNEVEKPEFSVYAYKSRAWYFPSYNFRLKNIWAPFLIKSITYNTNEGPDIHLYVDIPDKNWTREYHKLDYIVMGGGQWFYKRVIVWENNKVVGCHYCPGNNLTELGMDNVYRMALRSCFRFVSMSDHKPLFIFRTWTPDHFEYGEWDTGGMCNRTAPYKEGEYNGKSADSLMRPVELEEFERAVPLASKMEARIKLMDTYHLMSLRPDGHPGIYRYYYPDPTKKVQNDCLHWCLPGPMDTLGELLMKTVMDANNPSIGALLKDEIQSTYSS